ncbi:hypothetical protein ACFV08_09685 [Streptomyces fradiae]|uniref:hypothetical protein n=1 Tax=Streptomyces fradiae TaxID=1906 RepID=UPI00368F34FA
MSRPERGALPLPDFDELPFGALESRIRSLRPDELDRLLEYEEEHAGRPRVVRRRAGGGSTRAPSRPAATRRRSARSGRAGRRAVRPCPRPPPRNRPARPRTAPPTSAASRRATGRFDGAL